MKNNIETYYDARSDFALYPYSEDWNRVIHRFGQGLHRLIQGVYPGKASRDIRFYDCTCGIGTQAIGLAQYGYQVTASDLSSRMLEKS